MTDAGELRPDSDVEWLATSTLASLQGGLVLTRARRDPQALRRALDGALALIGPYRIGLSAHADRHMLIGTYRICGTGSGSG
jgi:hypothetical protein